MNKVVRHSSMIVGLIALWSMVVTFAASAQNAAIECAFTNPILPYGQDPSVAYHNGAYYLIQSDGLDLDIRRAEQLTELGNADPVRIFTLPSGTAYSAELWGPELEYVRGGWYIYFAADDGTNANHRLYALQADSADPLGSWTFKGKVYGDAATDKWAIDGSVFEWNDQLYMVWSGWPGDTGDFPQNLYIAPMDDPLTVGVRHPISTPDQPWEKSVAAINEGPEPFIHDGHLSIVYAADASWTAAYKLGLLAFTGDDPLDPAAWTKQGPVFQQVTTEAGGVYGPGHSSIPVPSPDGAQDWLVYHANNLPQAGWKDREIHAQPFTWDTNGLPRFGDPIPAGVGVPLPSGAHCGEVARYNLDGSAQPISDGAPSGTLVGSPKWIKGNSGGALQLDGVDDFVDLSGAALNLMDSFSVMAWVWLDQTDRTMTLVSQDGGVASAFALQYSVEAGNKFALTMYGANGKVAAQAVSSFSPVAGQWTMLVGVRDAIRQEIRLYVDGRLEATVPYKIGWNARGHTVFGAATVNHQRAQFFAGKLDTVRLFNGALSDQRIGDIFTQGG